MKTTTALALMLAAATAFGLPAWADDASATPETTDGADTAASTAPTAPAPADTAEASDSATPDAVAATAAPAPAPAAVPGETVTEETTGKIKVQSIRVADRFGTIEEERVPSMRSEVRYVPTGSTEGYNLVGSQSAQGKTQNVHRNTNELMIPSWKIFNW